MDMSGPIDFETLFKRSPNPYVLLAPDLTLVYANDAYLQVTGRRRENLIGRNMFEAFPADPAVGDHSHIRQLRASFERVLASRKPDVLALIRYAIPRSTPEGTTVFEDRYWSATHTPLLDARGEVAYILQHTVDITTLESLKRALREAEARQDTSSTVAEAEANIFSRARVLQNANQLLDAERNHLLKLYEQAPGFICFLRGPEHVFDLVNSAYYQVVGHRQLIGRPVREALPEVAGQGFFELLDHVYSSATPHVGHATRVLLQRQPGGPLEEVYLDFVYQPIIEPDGSVSGIFAQGSDVTDRQRAEDELNRYRHQLEDLVLERTRALEQSEAALRHAQKLEAVGRLTGGVAHDFNNLLQVIGGNLQLLERDVAADQRAGGRVQMALQATERGAKLASQLLAFARRQPLEPAVIDLGSVLRGLDELLQRAAGESIVMRTSIADDLWNTFADPNQIENVILNLVINARDAMEGGGELTVEAGNATTGSEQAPRQTDAAPGEYIMLAVSDTGSGMAPEVMERVFEPFFTTKSEGQGTGLGLSMVYGFVKQSGGHIALSSQPGRGTTIRIYLPRARQAIADMPERLEGSVVGGGETLLVVEDDPAVRRTAVDLLTELGYRVLEAADGERALALLHSGRHVDLLFTDVVMPGSVHGAELARQAQKILPGLRVLFTSGYAQDVIVQGGRLTPGVSLLSKPYRREDLARKVRHVLADRRQVQIARAARRDERPERTEKRGLRIMLVEDEELIRQAIEELLADAGHEVIGVGSAEEAQEQLNRRPCDVLFTDLNLPGASGADLATSAMARWPQLHVVIASGYGRDLPPGIADTLINAVFLPKPYDIADVERVMDEIMEAG